MFCLPPPGLVIIIKWAKCSQSMDKAHLLPIPHVPHKPSLDPVAAYTDMIRAVPDDNDNSPLLLLAGGGTLHISLLRCCFKQLLLAAGIDPHMYSLHSLRRGSATAAYQASVSCLDIARHGA